MKKVHLTEEKIYEILDEEKPNQKEQVKFSYDKVKDYFPKGYTIQQMQNVIEKLLQKYQIQCKINNMKGNTKQQNSVYTKNNMYIQFFIPPFLQSTP